VKGTGEKVTNQSELSFEQLYRELEESVRRLEAGELSLEESLALFERASQLAEQCNALLDQAELRVQKLVERPDGSLDITPFDG
jgi:exodeoxyribonuclease VII small subunit